MGTWTLTRTDTSEVHTFNYDPNLLPAMIYEQALTEHKLLSGDVKYDKSTKKIKTLRLVWSEHNLMFRVEREKLEGWLDLNCKMILKWFDHDGWEHNDKGYMMADSTPPIYKAGYGFSFILKLVQEA